MLQTALLGIAGIAIVLLFASYLQVLLEGFLEGLELERSTAIILALVIVLSIPGLFFDADTRVRTATSDEVLGSVVIQGLLMAAIGVVTLPRVAANVLVRPGKVLGFGFARYYVLFLALAVASTAYSLQPAYTLAKALYTVAFFGVLLNLGVSVLERAPASRGAFIERVWTGLAWSIVAFLSVVWVSAIISPGRAFTGLAGDNRLYGSWFHWSPNLLGQLGAVVAVVFLARLDRRGLGMRSTAAFVLGVVTVLAAWSRASIFAAVLAVGVLAVVRKKRLFVFAAVGFGILAVLAASDLLLEYVLRGQSMAEFRHATGRLISWQFALSVALERPLLGHGYYVGPGLVSERFNLRLSNLDNTFLEVWVDLGLIGLFLILAFFAKVALPFARRVGRAGPGFHDEMTAVLVVIALRAISGPTFHEADFNLILVFVIGLAGWWKTRGGERGVVVAAGSGGAVSRPGRSEPWKVGTERWKDE